jgi:hypothetical protein
MDKRTRDNWVPVTAAAAVAVAALGAAIMSRRGDSNAPVSPVLAQTAQAGAEMRGAPPQTPASGQQHGAGDAPPSPTGQAAPVVKAPPLKPPPKPPVTRFARNEAAAPQGGTATMGSPAACVNCGTVEMVVAVLESGKPNASGYQMHIRMDDGMLRTVEQRGALAAGSRVRIEGGIVRALAPGN